MKNVFALAALPFAIWSCSSGTPAPALPPSPSPATTAATPAAPRDIMVRTRASVGDSFVPQRGEAALHSFVPEVAADETGGECQLFRTGGSSATMVTAFYPARSSPRTQITVTFDSAGHLVRYSERRGIPQPIRNPNLTAAQLDSAVHAGDAAVRSTTISMDYPIDQAIAMNRGGGKPTLAVLSNVREMESLASLGPPAARIERMRKLCGV